MKMILSSTAAALALAGCASGPSAYQLEEQARARREAEFQRHVAAMDASYDRLRMPDGSTYSQKSSQLYGYIAMLLRTCDVLPSTTDAITWNLAQAQSGLKSSSEKANAARTESASKSWLNAGIQDVDGRVVDCRMVHSRLLHWRDWTKLLADTTRNNPADARPYLVTLEGEVGRVLANSPKSK